MSKAQTLHRFILSIVGALLLLSPVGTAWAALGASVTLASGQPGTIHPGETTQLQITLSNSNPGASIANVAFSNSLPGTLPNGLSIAGAASYSCYDPATETTADPGTENLTAAHGSQDISLSGGIIPARANNTDGYCTIVIPVTARTSTGNAATYTYSIASGAVTGDDGSAVANSGAVNQSVNVLALSKPGISKGFGSSTLYLGGSATTLTITLTNTNSVAIPNFSITDVFPQLGGAGIIKVAATPAATAVCNNGGAAPSFTPIAGDTNVTATGTIPAKSGSTNGTCTLTVQVEGAHTNGTYSTGAQTNTINASSQFGNDIGLPAAANATANVTVVSPLGVTKSFAHGSLSDGQSDTFTITLSNSGTSPLAVTTFDDNPIDGIVGTGYGLVATNATTTCTGGTASVVSGGDGINLAGGTIPAGGSCTVTVTFTGTVQTAGVPISYTNSIPAGAVDVGNVAIVSQARTASVLVADDLRVLKTATPTQAAPGNPVRYTVTVQNYGVSAVTGVAVTDHLTNGLTFLTGTINGNNYTPSISGTAGCSNLVVTGATGSTAPVFTFDMPARTGINTPSACVVSFYAMTSTGAVNGSSTANTINVGDVCYNGGANCNGNLVTSTGTTVTTTVLSATKLFDGAAARTYPEGTVSTLKITLSNNSANGLTNVSLSDTLSVSGSGQLRIASPANAATTCGDSPVITAAAGSSSVSLNGASVPARASNGTGAAGSCFIQVDVVGPAGSYPNTATVAGTETYADGTTHSVGPVTSSTATLTYTSALSATKGFNPATVSSGGKSTVTVRLFNSGAAALSGVAVTDPLPTGMAIATPPNAYTTCAGSTSITATAGASSATLSGASIAGSGNCDFVFDVVATGTSNWVNTIPIGNITASGGVANQTAVSGTLLYSAPSNPSIIKATNPSTLTFPGQISVLTITVTAGTQAVTNLGLTDYFTVDGTSGGAPNGMAVAPTPGASTTCPGGVVSASAGATSISLSGVSLSASASCTVSVNVTSTSVGGITNYIPSGAIHTDQGLTNSGQATTSLTTQSNIGVVKQFTPNVVKPGERSRLRITFYNPTSQPASNLAVLDTLPAGVSVPSGASPLTTCTGATVSSPAANQVQVSGGTIAAASGGVSASCYAEIDVLVAAQGDYVNTIAAGAVTAVIGGSSASNSQPTSDTLRAKSPLVVHKAIASKTLDAGNPGGFTTGTASAAPGAASTLTIRLDNPNAVQLTSAALTDSLPTGLVVAQTPNAATTCSGGTVFAAASATTIRLSGATIPASGFCTVTVDVLSNISGTYTNTIAAGAVTTNEGVENEDPTSARIVISTPPTVSKQFSPAVIPPNGTSTLTIVLGNDNSNAITLSSAFTDTLPVAPGSILVANPTGASTTCGGAVTAAAGSGTVSLASGSTIPAGGCSISVNVTGATSGVHTNNIPAGALVTNVGNNQQPANATLTISTLGYVSGRVFKDNNVVPNGIYDSGDTPIQGASIELHSGADCSGALVSIVGLTNPVATDALGNYVFAGLPAGTYSVCEPVQPSGTNNGITTAGTITGINGSTGTAGTASNPTTTTSRIAGIVLNGDGAGGEISGSPNNNFAEIVPSSISGTVFLDQNNNGVQNGADTGIAGVTVTLTGYSYGANGVDEGGAGDDVSVSLSTTTDSAGNYDFANLAPGRYTVTEPTQPAGTANGLTIAGSVANGGTAGAITGPTTTPSRISTIILPPNTESTGNNFAEIPNGRSLYGRVFLDYDNNGAINGADHGIGGQTINLTGTDINGNAVLRSATTAADGTYSFTAVTEGTYTVTQPAQPEGTTNGITTAGSTGGTATVVGVVPSVISAIDLTGGNTVSAENNFAEVPGAAPDLAIAKSHTPASFAQAGSSGYYTITPSNIGTVATSGTITVIDTLPAGITVAAAAAGSGWACVGAVGASTVACASTLPITAGGTGNPIILQVAVAGGLSGQILTNTVTISGGGEPAGFDGNNTATDTVTVVDSAGIQGHVWLDRSHTRRLSDAQSVAQAGWIVELLLNGVQVASTTTDAAGAYAFSGLAPGSGYQVRFRHPTSGLVYGNAIPNEDLPTKPYTSGVTSANNLGGATTTDGTLSGLTLTSGTTLLEQSLPIDPAGVVYDAVTRQPVSGAAVTIAGPAGFNPSAHLVGGNASVTTGADGVYQFLLNPTAPSGTYTLIISTYPAGYVPTPSTLIPVCVGTLAVGVAPDPALVQSGNTAPATSVAAHVPAACLGIVAGGAATTQYYASFTLAPGVSANVVNNHIPLDPILGGAIVMTKTTPMATITKGGLVPYTVTATNTLSATLANINVVDRIPPGFRYRSGSATLNGVSLEPQVTGRDLTWLSQTFAAGERKTFKMVLVVGAGVGEGDYVNQAWSLNNIVNSIVSNVVSATVRVIPDPTFDCSDIIGKVFDDKNANGYQDQGEPGIPNVRVVTARGLLVTTDAEGRFHVACAAIPQADHGSNFVMKLDERTLPSGYRLTTENPRDVRVTRGKMVKLNFGATVHRVVRLELTGAAFAESVELASPWADRLTGLVRQLRERPSVLRIAYRGEQGQTRLDAVAARVRELWKNLDKEKKDPPETIHPLLIETELEGAR